EAEGAEYPRSADSVVQPPVGRKCADASVTAYDIHGQFKARSGEFEIGGDLGGCLYPSASLRSGHRGKVWWLPDHGGSRMPPLLVRGRNLNHPRDTVRYTTKSIAVAKLSVGHRELPERGDYFFFSSGIAIPTPGRWLVIATSGVNWGCFILAV